MAAEYAEKAAGRGGLGSISLGHFYLRRARRILPAALTVIVAVLVASHLLLNALRVQQVQHDALWATLFASNVNFIRQATDYFTAGLATSSPFRHYWSLSVEEQFYLVWPALFLVVTGRHGFAIRGKWVSWRLRLGAALAAVGISSLVWSITDTAANPASAYFSTFTRAWELALGALVGIVTMRTAAISYGRATSASAIGVALLVLGCIVIDSNTPFPGYVALLPTLGAGLLILGGMSRRAPPPNRILDIAPMRFLGRISYSLYLWHWPLIVFAAAMYPAASTRLMTRAEILALTIVVSTVSYYAVERPFRRMSFTRLNTYSDRALNSLERRGFRALNAVSATVLCAVSVVGIYVLLSGSGRPRVIYFNDRPIAVANAAPRPAARTKRPTGVNTRASVPPAKSTFARWEAKVSAALKLGSLPSGLQPLDRHLANVNAPCQRYRLTIAVHERDCMWGSPNARYVAAITGDSHAGMWLTTLEGALNPQTWSLHPFTRAWCGWSGGSENIAAATRPLNSDCAALQAQALRELKRLHVDLLIVSEDGVHTEPQMTDALSNFAKVAKTVVVLGHTPTVVPDFANCLRGSSDISACSGHLSAKDLADVALEQHVAEVFNDPFIDTTSWFCSGGTCPPVIDDVPSFADGSHISAEIAPKLIPLLQASLRETGALTNP